MNKNNFSTIDDLNNYFKELNIQSYLFTSSTSHTYDIKISFDDFIRLIETENINLVFKHYITISIEDFLIPTDYVNNFDINSIPLKQYLREQFKNYNEQVLSNNIDNEHIGSPYMIILMVLFNGIKIIASVDLELDFQLPDLDEIAEEIYNKALMGYEEYEKSNIIENNKKVEKLNKFLLNDSKFYTLKNDYLRRTYLEKLKINHPDIYKLFDYCSTPRNPLNHLNYLYQFHRK